MNRNNPSNFSALDQILQLGEETHSFASATARDTLQQIQREFKEAKKLGNKEKAAWSLVQMATVLRGQRKFQTSIPLLDEARTIFSQSHANIGLATAYYEMSYANRELERNALALEYGHLAVKIYQEMGRTLALAWAYDNLSAVFFNLQNRHESLSCAKKARAIFLEFRSRSGIAWNGCNLGNIYFEMGYYPQAEKFFSEAADIFTSQKNQQGLAWAYLGLGMTYRAAYKLDVAMEYSGKPGPFLKKSILRIGPGGVIFMRPPLKESSARTKRRSF